MIIAAYAFLYLLIGFLMACWNGWGVCDNPEEDDGMAFVFAWVFWPVVAAFKLAMAILRLIGKLR